MNSSNSTNPPHPPPSSVTISPCAPEHIPALRRINSLLLPIPYPNSFYKAIADDPVVAGLAHVALWRDEVSLRKRRGDGRGDENGVGGGNGSGRDETEGVCINAEGGEEEEEEGKDEDMNPADDDGSMLPLGTSKKSTPISPPPPAAIVRGTGKGAPAAKGKVIGGIRCRLEQPATSIRSTTRPPYSTTTITTTATNRTPRVPSSPEWEAAAVGGGGGGGGGSAPPLPPAVEEGGGEGKVVLYIQTLTLLSPYRNKSIATALLQSAVASAMRKHGISAVYAHVWEANEEALVWYRKRGFVVGELVADYYVRLRPAGARVVWRAVGIQEYLALGPGTSSQDEDVDVVRGKTEQEEKR